MRTARSTLILASLVLAGCAQAPVQPIEPRRMIHAGHSPSANLTDGCVADYRAGVDYFPEKSRFTESDQLRVSYHGHWKRVTFTPAVDTRETLSLVLVQCGTPRPQVGPRDVVVEVPVRSFATANASMLGAAVLLGLDDRLRGVPSELGVSLPAIRRRIEAGDIVPVYAATHGNGEQAAALGAELFFTFYSAYPEANLHPLLRRMGVTSAPQSDHTEPTPLGRAEWIKYLGLFFNREADANAIFEDRASRYRQLAARTRDVATRPLVQLGYPEGRDRWVQAGGHNQLYRLIEDAGGRHAWHDVANAGSLTFAPMERLYDRAGAADVWLGNFIPGAANLAELRRAHPRLAWMRPIAQARVWWLDAGKDGFRNPWSDQGMTEPQDALADFIQILHPELADPARRPRFARRIEEEDA
jgi:iron complex transport system substrate-binding protein